MHGYSIFCLAIFAIEAVIATLNFIIASTRPKSMSFVTDILCGVCWSATAGYWLWKFIISL